jgi:hypothetical protein
VQRTGGFETGIVAGFARATGRRFVFSSSSTIDFSLDVALMEETGFDLSRTSVRLPYLFGLRAAHAVVAQTDEQRRLAAHERGIEAQVIPSFAEPAPADDRPRDAFLWVGAATPVKDPLVYVSLAERLPEAEFRMVAAERGAQWAWLADEIRARATSLPNLTLLPGIDRTSLLPLYAGAVAVVSTSRFEGFPNVFLEGWSRGVPALSFRLDPDGVIEANGLGAACGGSLERLVEEARRLWAVRDSIDGAHYRDYVVRVHSPAVVGRSWSNLVRAQIRS